MSKRDYYEVLGVEKSATEREIKKAYKRLAMKYHPDRTQGDKAMEEKFKEVQEAYAVLSVPNEKKKYDILVILVDLYVYVKVYFSLIFNALLFRRCLSTTWRRRRTAGWRSRT